VGGGKEVREPKDRHRGAFLWEMGKGMDKKRGTFKDRVHDKKRENKNGLKKEKSGEARNQPWPSLSPTKKGRGNHQDMKCF